MEIMYPIVVIICFIIGVAIFFINFNKKEKYTNGKKEVTLITCTNDSKLRVIVKCTEKK